MLIDAHSHLDRYEDPLGPVLEEIAQNRILTITNSMDSLSYERNLRIGEKCELVLPAFGVHPWNAPEYVGRLEGLRDVIKQSPILGEIGLDHHFVKDASKHPNQRKVCEFFLARAREQRKLVNLHTRGAEREVLCLLDAYEIRRAIVHWYSGPLDVFYELVARGTYFTIGVELLYSEHIETIARELPSERLLTETDNPGASRYLTGKQGMPSLITDVIQALADVRKTTPQGIAETVRRNFRRLIMDDPWLSDIYARFFDDQCGPLAQDVR